MIITSAPAKGTLVDNGTVITALNVPFTVSLSDITGGKLVFTPALNANGTDDVATFPGSSTYTSFVFKVQDDGGTATVLGVTGVDTSAPSTFSMNVTPVNDKSVTADVCADLQRGHGLYVLVE